MLFIFLVTIELTFHAKFKSTVSIMPFKCILKLFFFFSTFPELLIKNFIVIVIIITITIVNNSITYFSKYGSDKNI